MLLDSRWLYWWLLGAALWFLTVALGLCLAPPAVAGYVRHQAYRRQLGYRDELGIHLRRRAEDLAALAGRSSALHLRLQQATIAYGLDTGERAPATPAEAPAGRQQEGIPRHVRAPTISIYGLGIRRTAQVREILRDDLNDLEARLELLERFESERGDGVRETPSISPLDDEVWVLTSPFGTRINAFTESRELHSGIDMAAPIGTAIRVPADGVVVFAGRYPMRSSVGWWRMGNLVVVRHGEHLTTLFGHCDTLTVQVGQEVKRGEILATVGNTGRSGNSHLHYEIRRRQAIQGTSGDGDGARPWVPVDPRIYMFDRQWESQDLLLSGARQPLPESGYLDLPRLLGR